MTLDQQESGTFLDNNAAGNLDGIFLLGWGADYPDTTNFLDYHFGAGTGEKFGAPSRAASSPSSRAARPPSTPSARRPTARPTTSSSSTCRRSIIAHGGSATAFKADVTGAHSSPLSNELFSVMKAGDRDTLVWMQNAEPLSLYCADETDGETLRACEQVKESLYSLQGRRHRDTEPALATAAPPTRT